MHRGFFVCHPERSDEFAEREPVTESKDPVFAYAVTGLTRNSHP
jgi:hypothetical protein